MSSFCPLCGNALLVHDEPHFRFCCRTCPYQHAITTKFKFPLALKKKEVDDVLGGAEAWENVDQTDGSVPFSILLISLSGRRGCFALVI